MSKLRVCNHRHLTGYRTCPMCVPIISQLARSFTSSPPPIKHYPAPVPSKREGFLQRAFKRAVNFFRRQSK